LRYLAECGYRHATGFDGYNPVFSNQAVLRDQYDCVLSQDVLEHVAEPHGLLDRFHHLTKPGGLIAIGTPNASAIDLSRADDYRHTLHAPYHRHIFSKAALLGVGVPRRWSLVQYYATQYANTHVPFLNSPFYLFFMRTQDDTLDCLLEQPPQIAPVLAQLPAALFWGMCGSYRAEETDVMAIFRRR
jgi:SAM-dependent methyltransferase